MVNEIISAQQFITYPSFQRFDVILHSCLQERLLVLSYLLKLPLIHLSL